MEQQRMDTSDMLRRLDNSKQILMEGDEHQVGELQVVAMRFIIFILNECQGRGAFSFEQSYQIKLVLDRCSNSDVSEEQRKQDLGVMFDMVENALKQGKMGLKESHYSYLAIQSFIFQKN